MIAVLDSPVILLQLLQFLLALLRRFVVPERRQFGAEAAVDGVVPHVATELLLHGRIGPMRQQRQDLFL